MKYLTQYIAKYIVPVILLLSLSNQAQGLSFGCTKGLKRLLSGHDTPISSGQFFFLGACQYHREPNKAKQGKEQFIGFKNLKEAFKLGYPLAPVYLAHIYTTNHLQEEKIYIPNILTILRYLEAVDLEVFLIEPSFENFKVGHYTLGTLVQSYVLAYFWGMEDHHEGVLSELADNRALYLQKAEDQVGRTLEWAERFKGLWDEEEYINLTEDARLHLEYAKKIKPLEISRTRALETCLKEYATKEDPREYCLGRKEVDNVYGDLGSLFRKLISKSDNIYNRP